MLFHKYSNLEIQVRITDWKNKVSSLKELENLVGDFNFIMYLSRLIVPLLHKGQ